MGAAAKKLLVNRKLDLEEVLRWLVDRGDIDQKKAGEVYLKHKRSKEHPIKVLGNTEIVSLKDDGQVLTADYITEIIADIVNISYLEIDPLKIDIGAVTKILPAKYVKRLSVLPLEIRSDAVIFGTAEPLDRGWMMEVSSVLRGKEIEIRMVNPEKVERFIDEFYTVRVALQSLGNEDDGTDQDYTANIELDKMISSGSVAGLDEGNVSRIVDWLFQYAFDERATDIHLEPREGKGQVRFRIDGALRVVYQFEVSAYLPVISRIKIMAGMKVDEKRRPQDGRIKRKLANGNLMEFRLSTIPTHFGEKLVIRIFDQQLMGVSFEDLGFGKRDIELWKTLIDYSFGLILVTGPTGSGKTTSLQTSLSYKAKPEINICTVEDPIEIVNQNFAQMQVNLDISLTFGNAIRSFLRQDPDVIMVGEIRDTDAANMAVQASLTGHLVLSTLHTNTALGAITRMIDLGVPVHLINASLIGILAQRLVRVLCSSCKVKTPTPEGPWKYMIGEHNVKMPPFVFVAKGCKTCKQTGYKGRVVVYEMIKVGSELKKTITADVEMSVLERAMRGKYLPLRLSGAQRVVQGITSIEEVLRVVV